MKNWAFGFGHLFRMFKSKFATPPQLNQQININFSLVSREV